MTSFTRHSSKLKKVVWDAVGLPALGQRLDAVSAISHGFPEGGGEGGGVFREVLPRKDELTPQLPPQKLLLRITLLLSWKGALGGPAGQLGLEPIYSLPAPKACTPVAANGLLLLPSSPFLSSLPIFLSTGLGMVSLVLLWSVSPTFSLSYQ